MNENENMSNYSNNQSIKSSQNDYLKYRNEELNKDVLEKMSEIHLLKEQVKSFEIIVENYKKQFKNFNSKITQQDSLKLDINLLQNKIQDLENESNFRKNENLRLSEIIHNKDSLINQFNNLVNISSNKFKSFEETNQKLKEENLFLKNKLDELNQKINFLNQKERVNLSNLEESKDHLTKKDLEIEKLKNDLIKKEEIYKKRYEDVEQIMKNKMNIREGEMKNEFLKEITSTNSDNEKLLIENEKLKLENKNMMRKIEDNENIHQDKEFELKKSIETKEREYEKLIKNLKDLQREIKDVDLSYKEKLEEMKKLNKILEIDQELLTKQLIEKDKQVNELENQILNLNKFLEEFSDNFKVAEVSLDNKDDLIKSLKNENIELLNEFSKQEKEKEEYDLKYNKEMQILLGKIKILENEKDILFKEKDEDHNEIIDLRNKFNNFHGDYSNRLISMEKSKENTLNRLSKEMVSTYSQNEDQFLKEISRLQNIIIERDKEKDILKSKFEKRLHSYKIKKEENEARVKNLVKSMSSLKDWAVSLETNISNNYDGEERHPINYSRELYDKEYQMNFYDYRQKDLLDSLRDIITKIDYKIKDEFSYSIA